MQKNIMAAVIAAKLAGLALNAIIYIAVYLVVFAILKIVFAVTGVVGRLPLIYQANKILGLAFGIGGKDVAAKILTKISNDVSSKE